MKRACGILLHITALPSARGIGDLGKAAYEWVDFLVAGKQRYWQILPLGPTGFGNSPYSSFSAFAGNPLLINLEMLVADGFLQQSDLEPYEGQPNRVLFEKVKRYKFQHFLKAFNTFEASAQWTDAFQKFCDENLWLENFAAYMASKDSVSARYLKFEQFLFDRQLRALKAYAAGKGLQLIGDLPMYVAGDSADRAEHPELFDMESGFTAGTPPSNAFPNGQQWGNPLYRWDKHRETGFAWWISRIGKMLEQVDVIRLDYFCGYSVFWATNGKNGHWRRGPDAELFEKTMKAVGRMPFIAEDLGEVTPEVKNLLRRFNMPGMKVLHYAFEGGDGNPYLPQNFETTNCLVFTGTHDNDTTKGWFEKSPGHVRDHIKQLLGCDGRDISWDLIKFGAKSKADLLIVPYQDILCLGSDARFNTPGTVSVNNWAWCLQPEQVTAKKADTLAWLAKTYNRV